MTTDHALFVNNWIGSNHHMNFYDLERPSFESFLTVCFLQYLRIPTTVHYQYGTFLQIVKTQLSWRWGLIKFDLKNSDWNSQGEINFEMIKPKNHQEHQYQVECNFFFLIFVFGISPTQIGVALLYYNTNVKKKMSLVIIISFQKIHHSIPDLYPLK